MEYLFWFALTGVGYAYFGYPLLLLAVNALRRNSRAAAVTDERLPSISIIIPVHNEERVLERKIDNLLALDYPAALLEVIFVSDGSTDRTETIINSRAAAQLSLISLPERGGKARALNAGLAAASHEIIVFTDAAIMLDATALRTIVRRFRDPAIGCVSGQDIVAGTSGEGLYGRYELFLRAQESRFFSIVGASGSFYAQRKELCEPFAEGAAPDFQSVLQTLDKGYRAVSEPAARGTMTAVQGTAEEFNRKVRTLIRGMTALFRHARLLKPWRAPAVAFTLVSHKIMRWLVPIFLLTVLASNLFLLTQPAYRVIFLLQMGFYAMAWGASVRLFYLDRITVGRIALYFTTVNLAILVAWYRYLRGTRLEIWKPSQR